MKNEINVTCDGLMMFNVNIKYYKSINNLEIFLGEKLVGYINLNTHYLKYTHTYSGIKFYKIEKRY